MTTQAVLPGLPVEEKAVIDQTHAEEQRLFEAMMGEYAWSADYLALLKEGWYWRDACYIAWKAMPRAYRTPSTAGELANIIGITPRGLSDRINKNPAIKLRTAKAVASVVYEHVDEVMDALVQSASNPSYKHHPDRKMYLEMAGIYQQKQSVLLGETTQEDDLSKLSKDELARLAQAGMDDPDNFSL